MLANNQWYLWTIIILKFYVSLLVVCSKPQSEICSATGMHVNVKSSIGQFLFQGRMMPQNTMVYCMVAVGTLVVLGTNTGHLLVYEDYDKKEHRLPPLKDSIICLYHVK